MDYKEPDLKRIKVNNSIAIGGMIALGKSTLTAALSKELNYIEVSEINERDELTQLLLEKMYARDGNNTLGPLFQIYFILERYKRYKQHAAIDNCIFDRTIFEDWLFAHENINDANLFNYYSKLGVNKINDLLYTTGVPKLYIILDGDGDLFKTRLLNRARPYEVENFAANELYFKNLLKKYREYLINVCETHGIDYLVLPAIMPTAEKIKGVKNKLDLISVKNFMK